MADVTPSSPEALCAREPIHIPGAIQPHGWLLAVHRETFVVEQMSANWEELLETKIEPLLGASLETVDESLDVAARGNGSGQRSIVAYRITMRGRAFDVVQHLSGETWVIELEPAMGDGLDFVALQEQQASAIARLQSAATIADLCQVAAEEVAELCGFDRVMIYKFHPDWHGEVIAEVRVPDLEPFFGLHYPSSDIPEQARRLYTNNWLRLIARSDYRPVPLVPGLNPRTGESLDLTHSSLRSVSPVHLEYLRNMGVSGSMSVSIIDEGRLWGLIACHHQSPRILPVSVRIACEFVGRVTSALLGAAQRAAVQGARLAVKGARESFLDRLAERPDFSQAVAEESQLFLALMKATSGLVVTAGKARVIGQALPSEVVSASLSWLRAQSGRDFIAIDRLAAEIPALSALQQLASGMFAIALTETMTDWLVWFRPEQAQTVNWAGNPDKSMQDLSLRMQPRKSFALWTQQVTGVCAPWTEIDEATALEMRAAANASIRRRTEQLMQANEELSRKNSDLNSFAFIASHDLREPLRGIRNILEFIREDYALPEAGLKDLEVATRTAERMHDMLDALLHYTRVGRAELSAHRVPLGDVVERALEFARPQWSGQNVLVEIAPDLPSARCDRLMMVEVITNLLTNAVKYNRAAEKRLRIYAPPSAPGKVEIAVQDNGIGIEPRYFDDIFTIFRRLHPRGDFQGGLGIGLAVVKSIVERHGGAIRLESSPEGTTFFVTLDS